MLETRDELMAYMPKGMIWAEIGCFKGEFSKVILALAEPKRLHLVDPWQGRWCSGGKDGDYDEWIDELHDEYLKLRQELALDDRVVLWKRTGAEFFKECRRYLPYKVLDAVYLDALHDYKSVKQDLEDALGVTKRYILGHDYHRTRFPGCCDAVDEFCAEHKLKVTHLTEDGCPTYLIPLR